MSRRVKTRIEGDTLRLSPPRIWIAPLFLVVGLSVCLGGLYIMMNGFFADAEAVQGPNPFTGFPFVLIGLLMAYGGVWLFLERTAYHFDRGRRTLTERIRAPMTLRQRVTPFDRIKELAVVLEKQEIALVKRDKQHEATADLVLKVRDEWNETLTYGSLPDILASARQIADFTGLPLSLPPELTPPRPAPETTPAGA